METGRSSSYQYSESTKTTTTRETYSKGDPAAGRHGLGASFSSFSVRSTDNGKESLSWQGEVVKSQIKAGQVYTVAGASKLGDRNIDIYVTQSGKVHQSSPGNRLVHYGTGDEFEELKPGEAKIEKSKLDKGDRPAMYLSENGRLTVASDSSSRLFKLGGEDEAAELKSGEAAFKYIVSKQKMPFLITPKGVCTLKPETLYKAQDGRPEIYVSKECVLTQASDTTSRLHKLGDEDEAIEYEPNLSNFNLKVSQKGHPYCVTSTGASGAVLANSG